MIKIVHGNLLDSDAAYICHQVNCQGVMGSGVARQIRERWPMAYEEYLGRCYASDPADLLGEVLCVNVASGRTICNLFGQLQYGKSGSVYTSLADLRRSCEIVVNNTSTEDTIAMPYRIGCGLGGGDWGEVVDMLTDVFKDRDLTLYKMM